MSDAIKENRRKSENITLTFDEIMDKIKSHFGKDSKQYLFISMYNDIPTRDDCRKLRVYQADFDRP